MDYRKLGRLGVRVSPLCLGTMNWGAQVDERSSWAVMDEALEQGINFFDTANGYGGGAPGEGVTEQIIGRWIAQGGGRREKIVLATKVFGSTGDWPNFGRLSALHIRRACEDSLRRLQTDHIDLFQMHHIDRDTPWDEIWQAMDILVQEGKVLYVGTSNFPGWSIAVGNRHADRIGHLGLAAEQCLYNLSARMSELEVLPACEHHGMAVIPWSPLGGGLLGGALTAADEGRRSAPALRERVEARRGELQAWEALCAELGEHPADVALAWLLAQPAVTAPIIGPRTVEQLTGALGALEIVLDAETLARIDEIFPGPGAAPESYAW
jgi:aryl-alcohol dehydrogenase-like predicted oxidoreductase